MRKEKKTGLLAGDIPGLSHSITRGVRYINENHERASYPPLAVTLFIVSRARARARLALSRASQYCNGNTSGD